MLRDSGGGVQPVYREFLSATAFGRGEVPLHQHHDYELIRVAKGCYACELNHTRLTLRTGDAVLIKPGDLHRDIFEQVPVDYQALSFYVEGRDNAAPRPVYADEVTPEDQKLGFVRKPLAFFFGRFSQETRERDRFSSLLCQVLVADLFWTIVRSMPGQVRHPELVPDESDGARFSAALRDVFAQAKRRGAVEVATIAEAMHMSRRNLARKCQLYLRLSPANAFLHYRVQVAAGLLRQTGMNCKEVAAYLDFANPYHFSVSFKRVTGISPQAYKDGADPHGPRLTPWPE